MMAMNKLLYKCKVRNRGTMSSPTNYGGLVVVPVVVIVVASSGIERLHPLNSLGASLSGGGGAPRALRRVLH